MHSLVDAFVADLREIVRQATLEQLALLLAARSRASAAPQALQVAPLREARRAVRAPRKRQVVPVAAPESRPGAPREKRVKSRKETQASALFAGETAPPAAPPAEPETHPFVLRRNGERVRRLK